jgi:RNA-directed DNA polymerase
MNAAISTAPTTGGRVIDATAEEARAHFLQDEVYFGSDMPPYMSFQAVLWAAASHAGGVLANRRPDRDAASFTGVNYQLLANKDGRFDWRPYELIHPILYAGLVDHICEPRAWAALRARFAEFEGSFIECCSAPVLREKGKSVNGSQVWSWWTSVEQRSIELSLEFRYLLHTDVANCYGSVYTHSIAWAIHGQAVAKAKRHRDALLGNQIDFLIRAGRNGQTNGIGQGSGLMDFVAELVLGYVDLEVDRNLRARGDFEPTDVRVLRYRDDYRIFAHNEGDAERVLQAVSESLRAVGMKLSTAKTRVEGNIVEGSLKPDKLAAIQLSDLGLENAKTLQKQLIRIHAFGQRFPNSGALRRFMSRIHERIERLEVAPGDLAAQVAIATDIGFGSPAAFPAVAGVLSHLLQLAPPPQREQLWGKIREKMGRVPNNGYLEIWMQRIHAPAGLSASFDSSEPLCRIAAGDAAELWCSDWIADSTVQAALDPSQIRVGDPSALPPVVEPDEIALFHEEEYRY